MAQKTQKSYPVSAPGELLPFLVGTFPDKSRTTVKSYLSHRQVLVNGRVCSQFNEPLKEGDEVTVHFQRRTDELRHPKLRLIYEDDAVVVIDKQSGLLSMGTDRERMQTAYFIVSDHVKKADPRNRIFILHRLDRDTSGVMMFAKSEAIQQKMQADWDNAVTERKYVAVVEGVLPRAEGQISTYLTENKGYKVFVSNRNEGDPAVTSYKVLKTSDDYTLVELQLTTGRKNQIRAHMEYIGHPVTGDPKYGASGDPIGRVALHAQTLSFVHPESGEPMSFSTSIPGTFLSLFDSEKKGRKAEGGNKAEQAGKEKQARNTAMARSTPRVKSSERVKKTAPEKSARNTKRNTEQKKR